MKPNELPARAIAAKLARRDVSCEAVANVCLERIAAREPDVGAWAHLDRDSAIARARLLDTRPASGCLHGVPLGVKDVIETSDLPAEYGSSIYKGHRPAADAACVAMARYAGALILGKTLTTEFATSTPSGTRKPHNPAHTLGGSSSGIGGRRGRPHGSGRFRHPDRWLDASPGKLLRHRRNCVMQ